ncbi:hypothetical protein A3A84_01465 [Candidatus Collierbacteria bacterium RIFCSPLOWO2_01_FULL_50_23]|uniref:PpiC domain-containing protein n=2 Tax=Candidatus Collieribacteriota TaxID=1752725 RepID=A0A1F5EVQ5_9BACT|nr:MAG: hypothetical protein A3D09_02590 [Candidatus Collierbacteria bacterium RIFCSPHIGHO2_02_FULL_49_10]OGD71964.1 MAG: hypothetical protein A2703_00425 [Candidatus Collierbacteria bacterium RIFCSPHIGHO2_01_FULL_50_25]OGD74883.1 MAG: hypothetical protein A3A84_01465 [Candidatus Collierbacteria bacterium RIFCSPLOWO2_01_FULL_50_23]
MKKTTKTRSKVRKVAVAEMSYSPEKETVNVSVAPKKFFVLAMIVLLGGLLLLGAKKYKGLIIAGKVNGQVVTRLQLEKTLNDRYAKQTFDDLAGTILVKQLAKQNAVVISEEDVNNEITATEQRLGGKEALQTTLDRMGYTTARFQDEMRTQVLVAKLASKVLTVDVTDDEVKKFFDENKTLFPDKKFDEVKADIKLNLTQQKVQQEFTTWFAEQKKQASIASYL